MTRSLSGGVLAGTDEPLMFVLAFPTDGMEQSNLSDGGSTGMPHVSRSIIDGGERLH
jgi:hypothetical protein